MTESSSPSQPPFQSPRQQVATLLVSVFIIAICGILYELLISTMSSYFQGSSVLHFSLVIGLFLSFMGVGSYLSRYLAKDLLRWFIRFEILLSLVGGCSALVLYFAFSLTPYYYGVAFLLIGVLGMLIGIEIPILTRIVREYENLRDAMAKVLSFDYLGALIASVAFPLILLPTLGVMRTAFVIGLLNLSVALLNIWLFRRQLKSYASLLAWSSGIGVLLIVGFIYSFQLNRFFDQFLYQDQILYSKQSSYQHLVITRWNQDLRLFIDGNLQFSSLDEYRYHEPLVHLPMSVATRNQHALILGGGDGLAAREALRYPELQSLTLVDLDPAMTRLGETHPALVSLSDSALADPRVKIVNQDAYKFIEESNVIYDVVIIDLPDPNNPGLGKLYSRAFYEMLLKRVSIGGAVITQSTSPYFAPDAFWCIHHTLDSTFEITLPVQVYVPTFGQWGFNLALNFPNFTYDSLPWPERVVARLDARLFEREWASQLRFLSPAMTSGMFEFDPDIAERPTEINRLDNQALVQYYEQSWDQWR
ncbi:MAG: polyamine aminopropyltransferase [Bacteroidota bacterium]